MVFDKGIDVYKRQGQGRVSKLSPYLDKLQQWLKTESNRGRKERRSVCLLYTSRCV